MCLSGKPWHRSHSSGLVRRTPLGSSTYASRSSRAPPPLSRESRMKCELLRPSRRAIPARAFSLKKYFEGIEPCSSTCDNEHTAASLGQAEILGVQDPPCWVQTHNQRPATASLKAAVRSLPQQAHQESIRRRCPYRRGRRGRFPRGRRPRACRALFEHGQLHQAAPRI